jgi:DNA-binding IclR family transcriptional regulator
MPREEGRHDGRWNGSPHGRQQGRGNPDDLPHGDVHTLAEIATATGLPLSTAHRLVRELAAWKILERTDDSDYCVGLPLRLIGRAGGTATSLEERACLVLQDLSQALDADVRLGVLGDRDVTYIEKPRGRRPVTTFSQGATVPAHATAMGKALLALSAPALVDMFLGRGLTAFTPFTLTAPDRFRRALAMARLRWLAVARWELEPDRSALAVPVFGPSRCAWTTQPPSCPSCARRWSSPAAASPASSRPRPIWPAAGPAGCARASTPSILARLTRARSLAGPAIRAAAREPSRSSARPAPPPHGR